MTWSKTHPPGYRHKIAFPFTCLTILWPLMCQNGQHITEVWIWNCMASPIRNCQICETSCMINYVEIFPSTNLNFVNPIPSILSIATGERFRELSRKQSLHSTQKNKCFKPQLEVINYQNKSSYVYILYYRHYMLTENRVGTVRQIGVFGDKNVFINQCEFLCHRT